MNTHKELEFEKRMERIKFSVSNIKRCEKKAMIKERNRILTELLKENVDMKIIQRITGARMSSIIKQKIKILETQLQVEREKEGKTP